MPQCSQHRYAGTSLDKQPHFVAVKDEIQSFSTSLTSGVCLSQTATLSHVPDPTFKCWNLGKWGISPLFPHKWHFSRPSQQQWWEQWQLSHWNEEASPLWDEELYEPKGTRGVPNSLLSPPHTHTHTGRPSSFALSTKKFPFLRWSCNEESWNGTALLNEEAWS